MALLALADQLEQHLRLLERGLTLLAYEDATTVGLDCIDPVIALVHRALLVVGLLRDGEPAAAKVAWTEAGCVTDGILR